MRYVLNDGKVVTENQEVQVMIAVTIPAHIAKAPDGSEVEMPESVENQPFMIPVKHLTEDQKQVLGITEVIEAPRPDERFYFVSEDPENPGQLISVAKDLQMVKDMFISEVNLTAYRILSQTDWMVVKAQETGVALNQTEATYRESVRAYSNSINNQITSAANMSVLEEIVGSIQFPART